MKIIRNYILKECILPFFISVSVLTTVFLLGYLPKLAHNVINKGVSLAAVSKVFLCYIPIFLGYTLPIACLAAVILTFGRMSADNEIIAIRASGIPIRRLLKPMIWVGVLLTVILFIFNNRIIPDAYHTQYRLLKETGTKNPTALLEPGTFISDFADNIIFIFRIEKNRMFNIRIYQPQENGPTRTITASEGEFSAVPGEDKVLLKLIDGTSDEPDFKNPNNFYKLNFKVSFITLDISKSNEVIKKKPKGMSAKELMAQIKKYDRLFIDTSPLKTELHRKISWSFSPLIFILLGLPMAIITHKREKSANLVYAIMFAAPYYLLSVGMQAICAQGKLMPEIGMWIPNIIGLIIVSIMNYKLCAS